MAPSSLQEGFGSKKDKNERGGSSGLPRAREASRETASDPAPANDDQVQAQEGEAGPGADLARRVLDVYHNFFPHAVLDGQAQARLRDAVADSPHPDRLLLLRRACSRWQRLCLAKGYRADNIAAVVDRFHREVAARPAPKAGAPAPSPPSAVVPDALEVRFAALPAAEQAALRAEAEETARRLNPDLQGHRFEAQVLNHLWRLFQKRTHKPTPEAPS